MNIEYQLQLTIWVEKDRQNDMITFWENEHPYEVDYVVSNKEVPLR